MVKGACGRNVEKEDFGGVAYADHACFIRGDGAVVYLHRKFYRPIHLPQIDVPHLDGMIVVPGHLNQSLFSPMTACVRGVRYEGTTSAVQCNV